MFLITEKLSGLWPEFYSRILIAEVRMDHKKKTDPGWGKPFFPDTKAVGAFKILLKGMLPQEAFPNHSSHKDLPVPEQDSAQLEPIYNVVMSGISAFSASWARLLLCLLCRSLSSLRTETM